MKKLVVALVKFFKKVHFTKYLIEFLVFFVALALFLIFSTDDAASNVIGTIVGFLFSTMILYIIKIISSNFEDILKVNCNTEELLEIYNGDKSYKKEVLLNNTKAEVAYADTYINKNNKKFTVVDDPNKQLELDDFILENYSTIIQAHTNSRKINGETIRLDKFEEKENECIFYLSRSTYLNHLVTNRAIDFILFDNITLRDIYEYGPTINPYEKSKMSNHVGINGLVFLSDGNILVPRRKRSATISKNKITSSIATKLNPSKDGKKEVDANHLFYQNIIDSLSARLKMKLEDLNTENVDVNFLGFGQSLYEAGKPQFYYSVVLKDIDTKKYYELNMDETVNQKIDADRCIYVADYTTFKFKKDKLCFDILKKNGKRSKIKTGYEMSYLCNIWHYEQTKK